MGTTILRLKLWYRLSVGALFVFILGMAILFGRLIFPLPRLLNSFTILYMVFFVLLVIALPLLLTLLVGYMTVYYWTYRLELGETHLRLRTIYHPVQRPFHCAYADIHRVQPGAMRGLLEIVLQNGRTHALWANSFEGGATRLLEELSRRVPAGCMEPGLAASLQRYTPQDLRYQVINIIFLLAVLFNLVQNAGKDFLRSRTAWNSAAPLPNFSNVKTFSLDSDGSPWMFIETGLDDAYSVIHVAPGKTQTWELPPEARGLATGGYPGVGSDGRGQPWVLLEQLSDQQNVLHWDGEAWKTIPLAGKEYSLTPMSVTDSWMWITSHNIWLGGTRLDLASGVTETVALPESALQAGWEPRFLHVLPNNDLLVLFSQDQNYRAYHLRPEGWVDLGYSLSQADIFFNNDLTLGPAGEIWLLIGARQQIGVFDTAAQAWKWYDLPPYDPAEIKSRDYKALQVDARGRVWAEGTERGEEYVHFVDVFQVTPVGRLEKVVRYTTDNSNYQQDIYTGLHLGPDGRMWSADDALTWIDSNAAVLPAPLPDWVVSFFSNRSKMIGTAIVIPIQIIFIAYSLIVLKRSTRRRKPATHPPGDNNAGR